MWIHPRDLAQLSSNSPKMNPGGFLPLASLQTHWDFANVSTPSFPLKRPLEQRPETKGFLISDFYAGEIVQFCQI